MSKVTSSARGLSPGRKSRIAIALIVAVLVLGAGTLFGVTRTDVEHAAISAMDDAASTPRPLISQESAAAWRKDSTNTPISRRQAIDAALNTQPGTTTGIARFVRPASGDPRFIVQLNTGAKVTVDALTGQIIR